MNRVTDAALLRLNGRTALVTGAGSGTGRAIAIELGRAGATVRLVARTAATLDEAAAEVEAAGGRAVVQPCDLTDPPALRALFDRDEPLDILVNNAGTNAPKRFIDVDDADLDLIIGLNMKASFLAAQAAAAAMLRRRQAGVILNITSQMGHVGAPDRSVYCMSKHGLEGLTKAMAVELAPHGIRVNSLAPTFVDTPLIRRIAADPQVRAALLARIPLGRMAHEHEIALAARYLCSDAAAMVTGTSLLVDGGWTAQ
ncbi:SDR family NAD(P)-dependent oxidoreductase [Piscinibacter sakaiensis]|uniref:SDR family NAD(P)-dependent oxidoreductase n=1 Tax=Piscinibacter sakaiensis TaxID=1547922 RepID=UPI003AAD2CAD